MENTLSFVYVFCCAVGVLVIIFSNNLRAIISAFLSLFLGLSGIYYLLGLKMVAVLNVIVFAGLAIVFSLGFLMFTGKALGQKANNKNLLNYFLGFSLSIIIVGVLVINTSGAKILNSIKEFKRLDLELMLNHYIIPFNLIAVIILAIIVCSVSVFRHDDHIREL